MLAVGTSDKVPFGSKSSVVVEIRGTHQVHEACFIWCWEGARFFWREGQRLGRKLLWVKLSPPFRPHNLKFQTPGGKAENTHYEICLFLVERQEMRAWGKLKGMVKRKLKNV